jgi:hypothetical protein
MTLVAREDTVAPPPRYSQAEKDKHNAIAGALIRRHFEGGPPRIKHSGIVDLEAVARDEQWRRTQDAAHALEKAALKLANALDREERERLAVTVYNKAQVHRARRLRLRAMGLHDAPTNPRLYTITIREASVNDRGAYVERLARYEFTLDWTARARTFEEAELRAWVAERQENNLGRPRTTDEHPVWDESGKQREHTRAYPLLLAALDEIAAGLTLARERDIPYREDGKVA